MVNSMSYPVRPAKKRLRLDPFLKPPNAGDTQVVMPALLRGENRNSVILKCLDCVASQQLLRKSNLIDTIVRENYLQNREPQLQSRFNIEQAKSFIIKQISPILYSLVLRYNEENEMQSVEEAPGEATAHVEMPSAPQLATPDPITSFKPSPVQTPVSVTPQMTETQLNDPEYHASNPLQEWLTNPNAPYVPMQGIVNPAQRVSVSPSDLTQHNPSVQYGQVTSGKRNFVVPPPPRAVSEAGIPSGAALRMGSAVLPTRNPAQRASSITTSNIDVRETQSVVSSNNGRNTFKLKNPSKFICGFCEKENPSPSAQREHEAIHLAAAGHPKQYQCKEEGCSYRSHRPREIWWHLKKQHNMEPKGRRFSMDDLIDHGWPSAEKIMEYRRKYKQEQQENLHLTPDFFGPPVTMPNFLSSTSSSGYLDATRRDRVARTEKDETASQHGTTLSMHEYSNFSPQTPTQSHSQQAHIPPTLSSNHMFSMASNVDHSNSIIMGDYGDQSSQMDFQMQDTGNMRNSMASGMMFQQRFNAPTGTQLLDRIGAHAESSAVNNYPREIDADVDAQGETDQTTWSSEYLMETMQNS